MRGVVCGVLLLLSFSVWGQSLGEALDATNLVWTTGGDAAWFTQTTNTHDGVNAVRTGSLGSNQTSWIETTVIGPATVSFWQTLSSDRGFGYSLSRVFTVNGVSPWPPLRSVWFDWRSEVVDLGDGTNALRWTVSDYYGIPNSSYTVLDEFTVAPPRPLEVASPEDLTVYTGEWASFSTIAIGTPPFQYQWRKGGTNIAGATANWLTLSEVTTNDAGPYSVVVSNSQGFVISSNALLTVLPPTAPIFLNEPDDESAYAGEDVFMWTWLTGSPPFTYQWRKNGTNLPGAIWSTLSLNHVSAAAAGEYSVVVSNAVGYIESSNAVLTVLPTSAPLITKQPHSLEVATGVSTWFSLAVTGTPSPYVAWTKVGEVPPEPPQNSWPPFPPLPPTPIGGANPPYPYQAFPSVSNQNAGVYFATATNLAGVVESWPVLLTVLPPITNLSSWWQGAAGLFVTNDLVFMAQGAGGLAILSVSNITTPVLLGGYNTPGTASAVWVAGGLAYVADGSSGLQILNVTNPFTPTLVGTYNTPGYALDVIVRSNLAFVADGSSGLLIFDVSNPVSPSMLGSYASNSLSIEKICLAANHVLVAGSALLVVDATNPASPTETGRIGRYFSGLAVQDQTIFAVASDGLTSISFTNPAQPVVLGATPSYSEMSGMSSVRVVNDLVYATGSASSPGKLHVFDARDAREPIPVGYYANAAKAETLWVEGNRVYLASSGSTVQVVQTPFNLAPRPPAWLALAPLANLHLETHGRSGLHYDVEYTDGLIGFPWLPLQTILQTNAICTVELPPPSGTRFFRLRQMD